MSKKTERKQIRGYDANDYKGAYRNFQGELFLKVPRYQMFAHTKKLLNQDVIPSARKCALTGSIDKVSYHNERYIHPTLFLIPLNWRVHILLHAFWHSPKKVKKAIKECRKGKYDLCVGGFAWMERDHHITWPSYHDKRMWFHNGKPVHDEELDIDLEALYLGIDHKGKSRVDSKHRLTISDKKLKRKFEQFLNTKKQ